ncbi:MAG TPA: hypothetical protein VKD43_04800 [Xanthobacteraceae bacterium]|nr:hypothetical protein [Xanthobacteraceae bacterium]
MDTTALAAAFVGAQAGSVQSAVAAEMLRMNANAEQAVAAMLDASAQNLNRLANVAAGVGGNLDISV